MHTTNKTRWKRVVRKSHVTTRCFGCFVMTGWSRWLEVKRRRTALAYYCVTMTNLDMAVLRLDHRKHGVQRRWGFQAH
jgi:hypothetical protein